MDAALRRSAAAAGLVTFTVTVTEELTGPLEDRKSARAASIEARASTSALLDAALAEAGIGDQPWVPEFVAGTRSAGILARAGDGCPPAISHAGVVLSELAAAGALSSGGAGLLSHNDGWWELVSRV